MAAGTSPIFPSGLNVAQVQMTAANAGRDGTGTLYDLNVAGANGSRIDKVTGKATVATVAGTIRLYVYTGSVTRLIAELATAGVTPSATLPADKIKFDSSTTDVFPLFLPTGWTLRASTEKAETWNMLGAGGDY